MTFESISCTSDVGDYAREIVRSKSPLDSRGFYIVNLKDVLYKIRLWKESCPRIQPFYAVKCNDDPLVLTLLASSRVNFDCASMQEMTKVLSLDIDPSRIVYAHPVKTVQYLQFARQNRVTQMTFDSFDELQKIREFYPEAALIIRLKVDDGGCVFKLSKKFGSTEKTSEYLMEEAHKMGLNVIGVSFHVGCSKKSCAIFTNAIESARRLFDYGERLGFNMKLLDIGGGFPGYRGCENEFCELAKAINMAVDKLFPKGRNYEIISEPGTFFVASAFTLFSRIIGKKVFNERCAGIFKRNYTLHQNSNGHRTTNESGSNVEARAEDSCSSDNDSDAPPAKNKCNLQCAENHDATEVIACKRCEYYINDSVYMSFNMCFFNEDLIRPEPLHLKERLDCPRVKTVLWGNTCDGVDKVKTQCLLPEMNTGDWLRFDSLGAYSVVLETAFNGMDVPERFYIK
ncbi:ornithine decarboxylase-like isoform X1 [Varroa jacobsoni]|nr:ornithine decarboxylase-like isoform X2 [Varroa destructor]XP_022661960.1 ornithine decarboxylase-like isoform X2 [Varroa destructor]XP_022703135.1 ornithine decarboxylase-like isoform X1 [Varroa jacobsoni]XP_022703136.1 ornithine decarboxylase-like isoform X1 [Varroa jacobsoni]XP_022703137.1 ornithine decarboxylase-like isoform X1 [Varroa jacobsoni]